MNSSTTLSNSFYVEEEETNLRLDLLITSRFPECSRSYVQHLIEKGLVLLNQMPVKKRIFPKKGDEIQVSFEEKEGPSLEAEPIPLNILFEDEHLVAVNKEPNMVTHPAPGNWSHTFVNALLYHCKDLAPGSDPIRPGIVHRLDKETSGVIIAAKTMNAQQHLIEAFSNREVEKTYLAICKGKPQNGIISEPIGRHPVKRKEMTVSKTGKEAISVVQTLAFNERHSLVLIKPRTGRTHQIRVHLKHAGCPILGDKVYGKDTPLSQGNRLLLHAYKLELNHPITKEKLTITAPMPDDFKQLIQKLFKA